MRLLAIIKESGIDVQHVIPVLREGIRAERLLCDTHKQLGNQKEYLNSELKIAQAELLLNLLRFNR